MTYAIEWHPRALKKLGYLPRHSIQRIFSKLDIIAEEPFRYAEHFEGVAVQKVRIGIYRLLVNIDTVESVILIRVFDKRGRIYKR